jgi:hypothetical protein
MKSITPYIGTFIAGVAATLVGLKLYEVLNKPKVAAPATTPGAATAAV